MSRLAMSCVSCWCCDPVQLGGQSGKRAGKWTWYRPTRRGGTVRAPSLPFLSVAGLSRVDDSVRKELGTYLFFWPRGGVPVFTGGFANASTETRRHGYQSDQLADGRTHPERLFGREGAREGRWRPNPGTERAPRGDWTACRGGRTTQRPRIPSLPPCGAVGEVTANGRRRPADAGFLGGFSGPRANLACSDCTPRQCMVADTLASMNGPVNCARTRQQEGLDIVATNSKRSVRGGSTGGGSAPSFKKPRQSARALDLSPCAGMCLGYPWSPGEGGMAARRTALGP
ncbi:hypothetical protein B0T18DRAFT_221032 [Schizothecium vesticola]|uniref:Uncharacterized protein n=1 Tax=Schizothecium vesticola TaxID=314040 RepID=A0AA40EKE3_9PEZI|nr:hypothetical protein B0T18DRAFT_221032 [Schizothecium vesticola]